jgi:hypothetical protein
MKRCLVVLLALWAGLAHAQFDHGYVAWDALLRQHVRWLADERQSRVDYAGFQRDRADLKKVLDTLSAVPRSEFDTWTREQRMAFLINAYNAFTVELVLTRYPDLASIKDLGSFLRSPWRIEFFRLFGEKHHLDWIENEQLRRLYAEPRVHTAINCASIGCPALRPGAFTAERIEAQLEDGMIRFLGDRTRNRVRDGRLEVSAIFKWFHEDFEQGHQGFTRVEDVFARHAVQLTDRPDEQARVRARSVPISFLDYDWSLNALGR